MKGYEDQLTSQVVGSSCGAIRKGTAIFELLASRDEVMLVGWEARVDAEGQGLASDDYLHKSKAPQLVGQS